MICIVCGRDKSEVEFRAPFKKCRECQAAYLREWRAAHPQENALHKRAYRLRHLDQVRAYNRAYSKSHRRISIPR